MCGRYLTPGEADLERAWDLKLPADYRQSFNLAPSQRAPVVRPDREGARELALVVWGFRPQWAKRAWINARSETVFTSRAFEHAARRHRCLVLALGWYEWQGEKAPKQPWLFHVDGFRPFAFAGIWTPGGPELPHSFAILTTDAPPALAGIHDRMPVVVNEADYARWLAPDCGEAEAQAILGNNRSDMAFYKVSPYVNKPEHNDAACIRPVE
ncbi:MAG TPA: SOS response-associated peptidase [Gammaproteobacteria bacterium]|nr:SOS response-associated peptidase [Gammaproteobacteria bacterium]